MRVSTDTKLVDTNGKEFGISQSNGIIDISSTMVAGTAVYTGRKTTTIGTAIVLANSTSIKSVSIQALPTNTGNVFVGNSSVNSSNGYILGAGESIAVDINNLNLIYIDVAVNNEGVGYIGVT